MKTATELIYMLTALLGFLSALIGFIFYIIKRQYYENKEAFPTALNGKGEISHVQDDVFKKYRSRLKRILTLTAQNGGGMPRVDRTISVSVYAESCNLQEEEGLIQHWQARTMDAEYIELMFKMLIAKSSAKGFLEFDTDELKKYGMLRTTLKARGVNYCRMYYVGIQYRQILFGAVKIWPRKMFYIGVNFAEVPTIEDPVLDDDLSSYVAFLRRSLRLS